VVPEQKEDKAFFVVPWFPTVDEVLSRYIWPAMPENMVEDLVFHLTYVQHGGSGLGWTREDVMQCGYREAIKMAERLQEERRAEAQAIRAAHAKARRK
jgi:hypothetical protein